MANHILSLETPDTLNDCILRVVDTSIYSDLLSRDCPRLEITYPGFSRSYAVDENLLVPGFILNLTSCDLGIQTTNCGSEFYDLSDGVYIIKYALSPHDVIYVEYNHLRITKALNIYKRVLCELDLAACTPTKEQKEKLNKLQLAKSYLDAAKASVEICHEPEKGMELYNYALKLLNGFNCKTCK
jgi:hypothetical protein